jgi:hypothetical protein
MVFSGDEIDTSEAIIAAFTGGKKAGKSTYITIICMRTLVTVDAICTLVGVLAGNITDTIHIIHRFQRHLAVIAIFRPTTCDRKITGFGEDSVVTVVTVF